LSTESTDVYRARRKELEAAHLAGAGGMDVCLRHSLLVDQLVSSVLSATGGPQPVAVVAAGGYGRQELCFESDIDLIFLVGRLNSETTALTKQLFYGLLGLGLAVSHQVRTVADCIKMADDISSLTALLDCRLIAGDPAPHRELEWRLRDWLSRHGPQVTAQVMEGVANRHGRYRNATYLFEPHVKEGLGGLRDAHALLWAARGAGAAPLGPADLVPLGLIDPDEADALKGSIDFLLRVRNHLHLTTGKKSDRLLFAQQRELAAFFGLGENGTAPVEAFMRLYHRHAEQLAYHCRMGLRRLRHAAGARARSAAAPAPAPEVRAHPEVLMRLFAQAAARDGEPEAGEARLVRQNLGLVDDAFRRSPMVARHFLDLLSAKAAAQALENMLHLGLLSAYIPEIEAIRYLVQHDGYHVFTADVHSVETVAELAALRSGDYDTAEPTLGVLMRELDRPDLLLLAALLHDIGKGTEEPHEVRGAALVVGICERLGLSREDTEMVRRLVEGHLILSEASQRSDLGDEDLLDQLARTLSPGLLRMLYLLTFADSRATGPFSWTSWKSALIRELFFKLLAVLERPEAGQAAPAEAALGDALARLSRHMAPERAAWHLEQLPADYLAAVDPAEVCEQALLAEELLNGHQSLTWRVRTEGGLSSVSLCALDRPGLLAKAAGLFALHHLSIHEARLFTRKDSIVVDTFRLSPVLRQAPAPDWEKVMADLAAGLSGRLSLPYRLARKLRPSPLERHDLPSVATQVTVNNELSSLSTVIEIRTRDRVGLLYMLAQVLFELELNILLARVTTKGHQACDVFFVRDFSGNKVFEPDHVAEIERAIRFALGG
jgi:[protein-PII] uridylyltransferase